MQTSATTKIVQRFASEIETVIDEESKRRTAVVLRQLLDGIDTKAGNGHSKMASRMTSLRSAKHRAQNVLQGKYMGNLRSLSATEKKKVKADRQKNGLRSAIALAQKLKAA